MLVATTGLGLLALSLAGGASAGREGSVREVGAWLVASAIVAALASLGGRALVPGAGLGLAAGVLYAAGDVATKAALAGGVWLVLVAIVLAAHGGAFAVLQLGFQRGGALATAGTSTLLTNALPIAAGVAVFHDSYLEAATPRSGSVRSRRSSQARACSRLRTIEHEDPVLVAPEHRAGPERRSTEHDRHVDCAFAVLVARARARADRLDPDREVGERLDVAHAAVDHKTRPPVRERRARDVVTDERAAERAAGVDHEHASVPRLGHALL